MIRSGQNLAFVAVLFAVASAKADEAPPKAADLVREVRASESWIEHVNSFQLTADISWHKTLEQITRQKAELAKQFPATQPTEETFPELRADMSEHLELAFDKSRLFKRMTSTNGSRLLDEGIWDGRQAYMHEKYTNQELYALDKVPFERIGQFFLLDLSWPRGGDYNFWWIKDHPGEDFYGPADEFRVTGRENYRGIDCWKLECDWYQHTWYVGVADHRLYCVHDDVYHSEQQPKVDQFRLDIAKEAGHPVKNQEAYDTWYESLSAEQKHQVDASFWKKLRTISVPYFDLWSSNYREVAPGDWLPMTQGCHSYTEDGQSTTGECSIHITDVKVNQPLPDSLFHMEFTEGIEVNDWGHQPPLQYKYKKHFTADEWNAILAKGAENAKAINAYEHAGDDLIGKPAIPFPSSGKWLNSQPLTLSDLKGKVVILDFFSESCGPCRNDLPTLADLYKNAKSNSLTIIGIHTAGSEQAKIDALIKLFNLQYPIYVDSFNANQTGWGKLVDAYKVQGIPQAFLIGPDGRIAAHGPLAKVLGAANGMVGEKQ